MLSAPSVDANRRSRAFDVTIGGDTPSPSAPALNSLGVLVLVSNVPTVVGLGGITVCWVNPVGTMNDNISFASKGGPRCALLYESYVPARCRLIAENAIRRHGVLACSQALTRRRGRPPSRWSLRR